MKTTKKLLAAALALMMIFSMAACGSAKKDDGPILIGCLGPLTGENAFYGTLLKDSVTVMADECNKNGGILGRQVQVNYYDDRSDPIEATNAARKAIQQDKVCCIIGTESSTTTLALAEVCEENKVPFVATQASNIKITQNDDGTLRPQSFRSCLTDPQFGAIMGQYGYKELGYEKVAIIYNLGSDYSVGVKNAFTSAFEAAGGTIVATEAFNDGDVDFRAILTKIKDAGDFDAFYIAVGYYQQAGLIMKQARELGMEQLVMGTDAMMVGNMFEIVGDGMEGTCFPANFDVSNDEVLEFLQKFIDAQGYDPFKDAAGDLVVAHDAWLMVEKAINTAGNTDPTAIRDALEKTGTIDILGGTLTIVPETHQVLRACPIYIIKNQEFVKLTEFKPEASN